MIFPLPELLLPHADHEVISNIPDRSCMYQGQTPQSFKACKLRSVFEALTPEEKKILTDACKILVLKGEKVHLVQGEVSNIKITYPHDLRVAEAILGGEKSC